VKTLRDDGRRKERGRARAEEQRATHAALNHLSTQGRSCWLKLAVQDMHSHVMAHRSYCGSFRPQAADVGYIECSLSIYTLAKIVIKMETCGGQCDGRRGANGLAEHIDLLLFLLLILLIETAPRIDALLAVRCPRAHEHRRKQSSKRATHPPSWRPAPPCASSCSPPPPSCAPRSPRSRGSS
jgi:hypothetical protein